MSTLGTALAERTSRLAHRRRRAEPLTYDAYRGLRYFQPLDGLRAVSILLVLVWHVNSDRWFWLSGFQGVAVFFVISGYLITTLCLREEAQWGRMSLKAFYIRRACRIFPLYFLVLGIYAVVDIGLNRSGARTALIRELPYYLTYLNDFTPRLLDAGTPFTLSWSLAVEEKFYFVWPLLAFVVLRHRPRARWLVPSVLVLLVFVGHDGRNLYLHYAQILVGCLLALALHNPRSYELLRRVARHPWPILGLFVTVHLLVASHDGYVRGLYAPAAALVILAIVVGDARWVRFLGTKPMVFIGKRAYGMYLVQMLCLGVVIPLVRHAIPSATFNNLDQPVGHGALAVSLVVLVVGTAATLAFADVLHRGVERPFIALGRRLTKRVSGHRPVAPARMTDEPDASDRASVPEDAAPVREAPSLQPS